ncbi:MAG: GNAT family N-acetyltransferase [Casimicrobiaceae bacterium]
MSDPTALRIRPALPSDQAALWDLLHVALWDPPPAPLRPREVLELPQVRIYAEDWGRRGDVGVIGELPGADGPIGACWMRVLPDGQGLAFVDERTPQLGIALFPRFQHQGHGRPLMMAALAAAKEAGYGQVSLTVHPENPAISLYRRCGFRKAGMRKTFHLMLARL